MQSRPSAADILEAISAKDDDVARKLWTDYGIKTGQSVMNRWRRGQEPNAFHVTVALLDMAGWLTRDAQAERAQVPLEPARPGEVGDELEAIRLGQQRLGRELALLRRDAIAEINSLRAHLDDLPSAGRAFPRPRQGRTASR